MKKKDSEKSTPSNTPQKRVTLRDIATSLGVSIPTVSLALKKNSRISKSTTQRVIDKAKELGYVPDPMLSALSHYRTSSKTIQPQAVLAFINPWENPDRFRKIKEFNLYWEGATETANRMGYRLEEFRTTEIPLRRISTILKTRNIQGILLPPQVERQKDWNAFPWNEFALVCFGRSNAGLNAHLVTSSQSTNSILAFDKINALGYKRIGFVCEYLRLRYFGIGFSWAQKKVPTNQQLPLLTFASEDSLGKREKILKKWLEEMKPDALLVDSAEIPMMLENLGYRVPQDIGLATTSIHDTPIDAGINQNPLEIGRAAARTLIALISEHNYGPPEIRNEMLIEGTWVDGPMLPPV